MTARLKHIDAPEKKQSSGLQSGQFVSNLLLGKEVVYEYCGMDRYDRMITNLKIEGKRVDSLIISAGWAWQYVSYSKDTMLTNRMKSAITGMAGLWACGVTKVCPPWVWRKYSSTDRIRYCNGCK